ncbi:MAG TPA: LD-carboxypeptidase [Coleofasciculaceae cyanobacterium]|jgi:muramoyltetrapeptide carboxypeptidase
MTQNRRNFLTTLGLVTIATQLPLSAQENPSPNSILKPPRLKVGDTVGLISPAGYIDRKDIEDIKQDLAKLGLKVKLGAHALKRYGYLAGSDANRAADLNAMFADSSVQAILPMKGGWGCNRILPLLDYSLIRSHPKIIIGLSDITSLLVGIYAKSGLVTFHGPTGQSSWNPFTVDYVKRVLFKGEVFTLQNIKTNDSPQYRVETITAGKARGKLVGGNLSVLSAMVGSAYLPAWKDTILFLEDIGEEVYRIDRMLTQLKLAGILGQVAGFVFGQCTDCDRITKESSQKDGEESLTLAQVLSDHIRPLGIPAWNGSMIGHIKNKFTIPIGADVEIDASKGTIQLLESAVT